MGLLSRFTTMCKAKFSSILDDAEDPAEMLDYSYERLQEMLREVKAGVVEMVTAKQRIQLQADKVRETSRNWNARPSRPWTSTVRTWPAWRWSASTPPSWNWKVWTRRLRAWKRNSASWSNPRPG